MMMSARQRGEILREWRKLSRDYKTPDDARMSYQTQAPRQRSN
jgi:hypothetical protein